jgi:pimeloyl-ACP methyl ester carboxylesterase
MKRTTVSFRNKDSLLVKGIVFEPDAAIAQKTGVVYLPGIVLGLTGVHRLSVQVACEFQGLGYPVFLFDHSRIGESEGELFSGTHDELVGLIKRGGLVDDTLEALDFFIGRCGLRDAILIGHCGGALTALYATEKCKKVSRLVLISPPLVGEVAEPSGMAGAESQVHLALYKRKIFSGDAWRRLLSGESDYRQILRTIKTKIFKSKAGATKTADEGWHRRFLEGLESTGKRIDVKIIYGDRDPGIEGFKSRLNELQRWNVRTSILPNSSHGFVTDDSMNLLMRELKA